MTAPPELIRNVTQAWGSAGERWLAELPAIRSAIIEDWGLRVGAPYPLSFHWVAPATTADGAAAVLKLGVPGQEHVEAQAGALRAYAGQGAVRLLAHDPARGALLLERAEPGTPAATLVPARDEEATAAATGLIRRLHRPPAPDCPLPDLTGYAAGFTRHLRMYGDADPLPHGLVAHAAALFDELCASAPDRVVLHGDLHHDNILRARREPWLAIDPHGLVGDPGFEVGALLYNPDPPRRDEALLRLVPARIEQLTDGLGMPVERVVGWGFVMAVLSEVWDNDAGPVPATRALDVALHLLPRLP